MIPRLSGNFYLSRPTRNEISHSVVQQLTQDPLYGNPVHDRSRQWPHGHLRPLLRYPGRQVSQDFLHNVVHVDRLEYQRTPAHAGKFQKGIIEAIHLIGKREGPGELWGEGVRRIAETYPASASFAIHVKGLELPAYDPRGSTGMSLAYATSDRGGCHLRSWPIGEEYLDTIQRMDPFSTEFKAELVKTQQDLFCWMMKSMTYFQNIEIIRFTNWNR